MLYIWNDQFNFDVCDRSLVSSAIRFTLLHETAKSSLEVGSETFYFPLLYYNGHGIKDNFYVFKNGQAVGKLLMKTSFEAYPPVIPETLKAKSPKEEEF